jgi:predicted ATPase
VGTGKSMLINSFLERLPQYVQTINISNPDVHYLAMLMDVVLACRKT